MAEKSEVCIEWMEQKDGPVANDPQQSGLVDREKLGPREETHTGLVQNHKIGDKQVGWKGD